MLKCTSVYVWSVNNGWVEEPMWGPYAQMPQMHLWTYLWLRLHWWNAHLTVRKSKEVLSPARGPSAGPDARSSKCTLETLFPLPLHPLNTPHPQNNNTLPRTLTLECQTGIHTFSLMPVAKVKLFRTNSNNKINKSQGFLNPNWISRSWSGPAGHSSVTGS